MQEMHEYLGAKTIQAGMEILDGFEAIHLAQVHPKIIGLLQGSEVAKAGFVIPDFLPLCIPLLEALFDLRVILFIRLAQIHPNFNFHGIFL